MCAQHLVFAHFVTDNGVQITAIYPDPTRNYNFTEQKENDRYNLVTRGRFGRISRESKKKIGAIREITQHLNNCLQRMCNLASCSELLTPSHGLFGETFQAPGL